ncbi:MAG: hypothetical protein M1819_000525 [Sarea resinae]|nr:MAG: hypothetical protein M1819_000525 [Sarea resinae]
MKSTIISPKTAHAAPFTPKGSSTGLSTPVQQESSGGSEWPYQEVAEFVPQAFDTLQMSEGRQWRSRGHPRSRLFGFYNDDLQGAGASRVFSDPLSLRPINSIPAPSFGLDSHDQRYDLTHHQGDASATGNFADPFSSNAPAALGGINTANAQAHLNPYAQDAAGLGGAAYYQGQGTFTQPLQYHLYAPLGPHRENLPAYQRTAHDFFISDSLREELQRKAEASHQVLPNSSLPQLEHFHSLVPLDTTNQKSVAAFGYPSWIYKATSSKDGNYYALRRLEGYRLTNEKAIRSAQSWKRVSNGSIVTLHDAFTSRQFGDSSLIFVTDYHPLSKTLAEHHFPSTRFQGRPAGGHVPEQVLWSYVMQISSALKAIHDAGLAARIIDASKILLTSKNRVRLNACGILDVVQYDTSATIADLQREDLMQLGRLLLCISTSNQGALHNIPKALEYISRSYTAPFKDCIFWLLDTSASQGTKDIDRFMTGLAPQFLKSFDHTLHLDDQLNTELSRELENSRLLRLTMKLNFITERPEFEHDRQWSETGDRYLLKLFRDYTFHQVDAQGNPVVDLGHVLTCLNKLDAGIEERISLVSRDEQNCFIISYRELKRQVEAAFQDLLKAGRRTA